MVRSEKPTRWTERYTETSRKAVRKLVDQDPQMVTRPGRTRNFVAEYQDIHFPGLLLLPVRTAEPHE